MRKFICLIIVLLLPAGYASADRCLEASFSYTGLPGRIETVDLYEQENQITAVSTFIPEYALTADQAVCSSLSLFHSICSINPADLRESIEKADKQIRNRIEQVLSDPVAGVYSGELFESAGSAQTAGFQLSELLTNICSMLEPADDPLISVCKETVSSLLRSLQQTESGKDLYLKITVYDNWQYLTAILFDHDQAVMTVSSDLTRNNAKRTLVCFSENGRHYFRELELEEDSEVLTLTSSLRSGSESTYQRVIGNQPLTTMSLSVKNDHFDFEMKGNGLSQPLMATGQAVARENGDAQFNAKVFIGNDDTRTLNISIGLTQMIRPVSFSDKQITDLYGETENAGFIIEAASNATELAAEILPTLPEEYQELLIKLIYP